MGVQAKKGGTRTDIEVAHDLLAKLLPSNTTLTIEETNMVNIKRYLIHVTYKSQKTGKTMGKTLRCDSLPTPENDIRFYTAPLVFSPKEIAREFNQMAWREKRARQEAWLAAGKLSNQRIAREDEEEDVIPLRYNDEGVGNTTPWNGL